MENIQFLQKFTRDLAKSFSPQCIMFECKCNGCLHSQHTAASAEMVSRIKCMSNSELWTQYQIAGG